MRVAESPLEGLHPQRVDALATGTDGLSALAEVYRAFGFAFVFRVRMGQQRSRGVSFYVR